MGFRKRRVSTPYYGHVPYSPITGQYANLAVAGVFPYCAMMQVAAEDTYTDYVICRGFDPRQRVFIDYAAGDSNKPGISVAKPYGCRITGRYEIGQIYPAVLPTQGGEDYIPPSPTGVDWRLGQNPGTTSGSDGGHPESLSTSITRLSDHNGLYVNWLLLDSQPAEPYLIGGCLDENHPGRGTAFDIHLGTWDTANDKWDYDETTTVKAIDWRYGVPYPDAGSQGLFEPRDSDTYGTIYECAALDCESPGSCGD